MKRGAIKKATSRLVPVWFPKDIFPILDEAVEAADTDRSKFIRTAVREKLSRHGVIIAEASK